MIHLRRKILIFCPTYRLVKGARKYSMAVYISCHTNGYFSMAAAILVNRFQRLCIMITVMIVYMVIVLSYYGIRHYMLKFNSGIAFSRIIDFSVRHTIRSKAPLALPALAWVAL